MGNILGVFKGTDFNQSHNRLQNLIFPRKKGVEGILPQSLGQKCQRNVKKKLQLNYNEPKATLKEKVRKKKKK